MQCHDQFTDLDLLAQILEILWSFVQKMAGISVIRGAILPRTSETELTVNILQDT